MTDDDKESSATYEVVIALLYAVAIGVNVYLIADELTNGALSMSMSLRLSHLRGRLQQWHTVERETRRNVGKVLWQATNIVEGNEV